MISPKYSYAYGRLAREIIDKLENFGDSLDTKIDNIQCREVIPTMIGDTVSYIITIFSNNQNLGEIGVSNRGSIRISLDQTLERIANTLETEYSQERLNDKLNGYLEDYLKLINEGSKIFAKLPHGRQLDNYPELKEFQDALYKIGGQTSQDIWIIYSFFDNKHNHEWLSNMTGLNKNEIRNIKDKLREAIGLELIEEIKNYETLRLNPTADFYSRH